MASTRRSWRCTSRRRAAASSATRSGSSSTSTSARGYGSSGSHSRDAEAVGADGDERVAAVGRSGRLDDARDRADVEARVAAADLAAALDEHDAELAVAARGRSRRARGSAARTRAAAAARAGTAPCRAGTSAAVRPHADLSSSPLEFAAPGARAAAAAAFSPPSPQELARALELGRRLGEPAERPSSRRGRRRSTGELGKRRRSRADPAPRPGRAAAASAAGWSSIRARIARAPDRPRNSRSEPARRTVQREQLGTAGHVEGAPSWNGSTNTPGVAGPTRKWPGMPTPCSASPMRRPDLDHQDAQRDRDAEPAVDHVVEQELRGIGVVLGRCRRSPRSRTVRAASVVGRRPAADRASSSSRRSQSSRSRSGCAWAAMRSAASSSGTSASGRGDQLGEAIGRVHGSTRTPAR